MFYIHSYINISDCDDVNNTAEIVQEGDMDITSSMIIDRSSLPGQEGSRSDGWSSENIIDTSEISFPYIQPSNLLLCNTPHNVILPV